jgi:hypothetical protein
MKRNIANIPQSPFQEKVVLKANGIRTLTSHA